MNRNDDLRGRTSAAIEHGKGDTARLATEWAMPFIPDDSGNGPTDIPFGGSSTPPRQRRVSGFVLFAGRLMMVGALLVMLGGVFAGLTMRSETRSRTLPPQTFAISGQPTVRIANAIGTVRVIAGSSDKVEVRASVDVRHLSRGLAERELEGYTVDVAPPDASGLIVINTQDDAPFGEGDFSSGWFMQRSVNLTVAMPTNGNLELNVAAGSTRVEGITGRIKAEVNAGGLTLRDVQLADGSSFIVNAGGIDFAGALLTDASVDIEVNAGGADFTFPRTTAARLIATADAGDVNVSGWGVQVPRTRESDSRVRYDGYLSSETATKSEIRVVVHLGGATIHGASGYSPTDPATPIAPIPPVAPDPPQAPAQPQGPGR